MVRRHSLAADFQLVRQGQDPTPGDVEEIRRIERIYREVGDGAAGALAEMQRGGALTQGRGAAMEGLREQLDDDLPGKLRQARDSYLEAADAYARYIPQLQEAQDTFDRAVDEARAAQAQATERLVALGAEPTEAELADDRAARERITAGQNQLRAAAGLAAQARAVRDRAAARCGDALDRAADKAIRIPRKKFFQRVADFFKKFPFVKILLAILIAIVTVFVPVVGLLLAGLLFVFEQVTAIATGAFQLGDFLVGLVGLIPGGSLLRATGAATKVAGKSIFSGALANLSSFLNNVKNIGDNLSSFKSLTVGVVLDFGKEAATAGLNGEKFNAGAAFASAAVGGAAGAGLKGLAPTRAEPPPPGPPGRSDFSGFEPTRDERADAQFQGFTSEFLGGKAADVVEAVQEAKLSDTSAAGDLGAAGNDVSTDSPISESEIPTKGSATFVPPV